MKILYGLKFWIKYRLHMCMEPGCRNRDTTPCFYPDNEDDKTDTFYCVKHAHKNGFCWNCGQFWGGVESFDFPFHRTDLCENCYEQEDWENDYEDDEEDESEYPDDWTGDWTYEDA